MTPLMRINLALLALVLALGTLAYRSADNSAAPVSSLKPQEINRVSIRNFAKNRQLHFQRQDGKWQLMNNQQRLIDPGVMNRLLGIVNTHSHRQFENNETNRQQFQLTSPGYQLTVNQQEILFGTTDPVHHLRYILLNDRIHLIKDLYLPFMMADDNFFVQHDKSPATQQANAQ